MDAPTFSDFFANGTGQAGDYFSTPDYQNTESFFVPFDGLYDSYSLNAMDPTYTENAVPLDSTSQPSSTGFWDSLGKALGDSFNTLSNTAAQVAGQNLANATTAANKKLGGTVQQTAAPAPAAGNVILTPTNAVLAVAVVALVVYLVAKKS